MTTWQRILESRDEMKSLLHRVFFFQIPQNENLMQNLRERSQFCARKTTHQKLKPQHTNFPRCGRAWTRISKHLHTRHTRTTHVCVYTYCGIEYPPAFFCLCTICILYKRVHFRFFISSSHSLPRFPQLNCHGKRICPHNVLWRFFPSAIAGAWLCSEVGVGDGTCARKLLLRREHPSPAV